MLNRIGSIVIVIINYLSPYERNIFQEQIPQQMTKIEINRSAAANRLIFKPKNGRTNSPTQGRAHIQTTMASTISSKCLESCLNMKCHSSSDFGHFMTLKRKT